MLLPTFLLSPLFGIVSDRINPRNGLIVTTLAHGVVAVLVGIADGLALLTLPVLIGMATLLGAAGSAHTPIRLALIPRLVRRQALPSAIGYSAMIFNTSRIIGPAVGAWLVAAYSVSVGFYVAGGLCIPASLALLGIPGITGAGQKQPARFMSELKAGFTYAASHRIIRLVLGITLINGLLGRTLLELLPAFSGQLLDGTAKTLATLSAIGGAGAIIGGLLVSRQSSDQQLLLRLVGLCLVAAAICLLVVQWLSGLYQFGGLIFVLSAITTISGTGSQALAQLMVDDAYRGRVLSLWTMFAMGAPAIGAVVVGALAETWGFPFVSAGIAIAALVLLATLRNKLR